MGSERKAAYQRQVWAAAGKGGTRSLEKAGLRRIELLVNEKDDGGVFVDVGEQHVLPGDEQHVLPGDEQHILPADEQQEEHVYL